MLYFLIGLVIIVAVAPFVPGLLGLSRDYVSSQLGAWQAGQRRAQSPDCMARIARQMAPGDVHAVASWLAAQVVPKQGKPAAEFKGKLPIPCGGVAAPAEAGSAR